jgi:hypothetical protein
LRGPAKTWSVRYRDGNGIVCEVSTGCRDKQAARAVLNQLVQQTELVKAKVLSPEQAMIAEHQTVPLKDHIKAYIDHLASRGVHADRVVTSRNRLNESAKHCGFKFLSDMNSDALEQWLNTLVVDPERNASASVYNGYISLWVAFGGWCAGKRMSGKKSHMGGEKRILTNPFAGMRQMDSKQDRRRVARALTEAELIKLLDGTARRPLQEAQTIRTGKRKVNREQGPQKNAQRGSSGLGTSER